jgi:hypothetical protein
MQRQPRPLLPIRVKIDASQSAVIKKLIGFDVAFGSSTDLTAPTSNFRFALEGGLKSDIAPCRVWATNGHSGSLKRHQKANIWQEFASRARFTNVLQFVPSRADRGAMCE